MNWTDAIAKVRKQRVEKPPKGWKTANQIATEMGIGRRSVTEMLAALGDVVERRSFKIQSGGQARPVPHYRLK